MSPTKVTYVIPEPTAPGVATVTVNSQPGGALISSAAPGLFSADGTGGGVALATAVRTTSSGRQIPETVYDCSTTCAAIPINLGRVSDTVLVTFQGTGIRGSSSAKNMVAEIGGVVTGVEAAGRIPNAGPGMDYVTIKIPHSLHGAGPVAIVLTDDGFTANPVMIDIK